jgi:GntR family transcriptional regulator
MTSKGQNPPLRDILNAMNMHSSYGSSPLYAQVADVLRGRIAKGTWPVGSQIPPLPALAKEFGAALVTVRQAIQLLKAEKLVAPERGRGTFVRNKPQTHPKMRVETSLTGLADLYRKSNPRVTVLEEGIASPALNSEDGIAAPKYCYMRRIHSTDRQITSVISAYIDERIFNLAPQKFRKKVIIPVLLDLPGIRIGSARQIITIGTADAEAAAALNISVSSPVAEVRRIFCDPEGTVIYLGELTYRSDFIRVDMDLLG